jgi:hypothetical protein
VISLSTAPSCANPSAVGRIFSFASSSASGAYTLSTYGFTANDSSTTLTFAINGDPGGAYHYWLLDSVSVNCTNTSTNVLINGGFEVGNLTGWSQYCATDANCGTGNYGQVTNTDYYSGTYCYVDKCGGSFDYLFQSFNTTIGDYYILSFYLKNNNPGGAQVAYVSLT